jgi:hypothetical protein
LLQTGGQTRRFAGPPPLDVGVSGPATSTKSHPVAEASHNMGSQVRLARRHLDDIVLTPWLKVSANAAKSTGSDAMGHLPRAAIVPENGRQLNGFDDVECLRFVNSSKI